MVAGGNGRRKRVRVPLGTSLPGRMTARSLARQAIRKPRLSVTDLCDLNCLYCRPADGTPNVDQSELLSVEELANAARALSRIHPIQAIKLSGGGPLVRAGLPYGKTREGMYCFALAKVAAP